MTLSTGQTPPLVTADMLADLPDPVQRYLRYTGIVGQPWINSVRLTQTGRFRQGLDRPWMPMTAVQTFITNPASFAWDARFKMAGLPLLRALDEYQSGHGRMFGKLAGLFTLFDVRDDKIDQGAMLRYLSEMVWFPTALLGNNIAWQTIDDNTAEVTFHDHGRSVSGQMHFAADGRPAKFTAMRYRETGGDYLLTPWSAFMTDYGVRADLNLPIRGQVVWHLPAGDLSYVELEITAVAYNA